MSKSLRNFFAVQELLTQFSPEVIRLFLISAHYRTPMDFSLDLLKENQKVLERIAVTLDNQLPENNGTRSTKPSREISTEIDAETGTKTDAKNQPGQTIKIADPEVLSLKTEFEDAMNDDFNTAVALATILKLCKAVNASEKAIQKQEAITLLVTLVDLLGIRPSPTVPKVTELPKDVQALIDKRSKARQTKDWVTADQIRKELSQKGIILEDTSDGVRARRT